MPESKLAVLVLSLSIFAGAACAHAQKVGPTLTITADACESLAIEWGQPDIAEACRRGGDLVPVLDLLLRARAAQRRACAGPDCPEGGAR